MFYIPPVICFVILHFPERYRCCRTGIGPPSCQPNGILQSGSPPRHALQLGILPGMLKHRRSTRVANLTPIDAAAGAHLAARAPRSSSSGPTRPPRRGTRSARALGSMMVPSLEGEFLRGVPPSTGIISEAKIMTRRGREVARALVARDKYSRPDS